MTDLAALESCSLAHVEPFSDLPPDTVSGLDDECTWHRVLAGHMVIDSDLKAPHGVFVLADGDVEVFKRDAGGDPIPLGRLSGPACFGEFAAIDGSPGSAGVRTETPCLLAEIPADRFIGLVQEHPGIALRLLKKAIALVRTLDEDVVELRTKENRVAKAYRKAVVMSL